MPGDTTPMRILLVGDVVGDPGVTLVEDRLHELRTEMAADVVVLNGENAARNGVGITARLVRRLLTAGADVITLGNHTLRHADIAGPLEDPHVPVIRPANLQRRAPGGGIIFHETRDTTIAVINLQGTVFMETPTSPWEIVDDLVDEARERTDIVIVDFHAEATSEKVVMAKHLDGKVTCVFGTHTHVQTSDARVSEAGTAAITDIGMTGPHDSAIGVEASTIIRRFRTGIGGRFEVADAGVQLEGALLELDPATGRALGLTAVRRPARQG